MRVILAQPRGFCAGVERAIEIVERALKIYGQPVYVRHEIVHNKRVVEDLKARGARFVEDVDDIPAGAVTIFSAHGVARTVETSAMGRQLHVIDATCPLVTKVHKEGQRYTARGYDVVLIGHPGHPEVEGTMGQIDGTVHLVSSVKDVARIEPSHPERLSYVTQTTLSVDDTRDIIAALQARFPGIVGPDVKDICYATQNRQSAVRHLVGMVDLILVVGAHNSSNSNRLREIGADMNKPSYLVEDATALKPEWLDGVDTLGISAGASAPEDLVQELVRRIAELRPIQVELLAGIEENIHFKLPDELEQAGHKD
ncbi:MAG: 4-hydroxy-3-methylbut-2-enyl diphosphate reductase [Rhodospirillaceae bacterium]